jgi:hypothetical protein
MRKNSGDGRTGGTSLDFSGLWRDFPHGLKTAQERDETRRRVSRTLCKIMKKISTTRTTSHEPEKPGLINYLALMHAISHPPLAR